MFERSFQKDDVVKAIDDGEVIYSYKDDKPFPSKLVLYFLKEKPIHVLYALNESEDTCIIITVYQPSENIWDKKFKTRK
jgi:hypothetical protein